MILFASGSTAAGAKVNPESTSDTELSDDAPEAPDTTLPLDQVFEILQNQRRRYILRYLNERDEPVLIGDLSEQIAAWENDKPVAQITSSERKRVYVGLYQCHLPKMDGMGIVEFNKPRGVIELGETAEVFDQYLNPTGTRNQAEPAWYRYYAAAAVAGVLALITGVAITAAAPAVPAVELAAVFTIGLFSLCCLVQLRWIRQHSEG